MPNIIINIRRNRKEVKLSEEKKLGYDNAKESWGTPLRLGDPVPDRDFNVEFVPLLSSKIKEEAKNLEMFRAAILGKYSGQYMAEYLLLNQGVIPRKLRGRIFIFPGALWFNDGRLLSPSMYWDDYRRRWHLSPLRLDCDRSFDGYFVRVH